MRIKNNDLYLSREALTKLGRCPELPIALSFSIAQKIQAINPFMATILQEHDKLIAKYAELDDMKRPIQKDGGVLMRDMQAFQAELQTLNDIEVEIPITPVRIRLQELSPVHLSPVEMLSLLYLFDIKQEG